MIAKQYIAGLSLALLVACVQANPERADRVRQLVTKSVQTLKQRNPEQYSPEFIQLCDEIMETHETDMVTRSARLQTLSENEIVNKVNTLSDQQILESYSKQLHALQLTEKEAVFISLIEDFLNVNHLIRSLRGHIERLEELMALDEQGTVPSQYAVFYQAIREYKHERNENKALVIANALKNKPLPAHVRAMIAARYDKPGMTAQVLKTLKFRIQNNS